MPGAPPGQGGGRKDALLSGPLPALRRRLGELRAVGDGSVVKGAAAGEDTGGFRSCFSRVLRPGSQQRGYRHAGRPHTAKCLGVADRGRLLLVGGTVRVPLSEARNTGVHFLGFLSVWQARTLPPDSTSTAPPLGLG